jgi:hypothetical protein
VYIEKYRQVNDAIKKAEKNGDLRPLIKLSMLTHEEVDKARAAQPAKRAKK